MCILQRISLSYLRLYPYHPSIIYNKEYDYSSNNQKNHFSFRSFVLKFQNFRIDYYLPNISSYVRVVQDTITLIRLSNFVISSNNLAYYARFIFIFTSIKICFIRNIHSNTENVLNHIHAQERCYRLTLPPENTFKMSFIYFVVIVVRNVAV